ncbi:uncharacterized protein LOC112184350 [Rosa chinensis]|uniref:uncharacterized protein LOC112184350 n=1 Tax=Rosa chinensis TaxID=74649 RepID=UPI000D08A5F8|nr:uncharacterized protein LOC112184350 [Rosa chinensis]
MVKTDFGPFPKPEQLREKKYYKLHNMWNHNTADCVKLKDQIQIWLNNGSLQVEAPKIAAALVDLDPFPDTGINMVDVAWGEKDQQNQSPDHAAKDLKKVGDKVMKRESKTRLPIVLFSRCKEECDTQALDEETSQTTALDLCRQYD